jgi:hypothetical protein
LLRRFAAAIHDLAEPIAKLAMMIECGESHVLERQLTQRIDGSINRHRALGNLIKQIPNALLCVHVSISRNPLSYGIAALDSQSHKESIMTSHRTIWNVLVVASALLCVGCQKHRWSGTWQDNTPGPNGVAHNGDLYCTVKRVNDENYKARFTGYCGRQFAYDITMRGRAEAGTVLFEGTADLGDDGGEYQWTGTIRGERFNGQYRSAKGKEGTFSMTKR